MIQTLFDIVEGWSAQLLAQLLENNAAFDASGTTIAAIVRDRFGVLVTVPCAWSDPEHSIVAIAPVSSTFVAANGPYTIRFSVTSASSPADVSFFPPGDAAQISVSAA